MSSRPSRTVKVDVLIVGSGPVGATYARKLVEAGRKVCMVEAGTSFSARPGAHLKNAVLYQRNLDLFSSVIRGHLHLLSVPSNDQPVVTLDPSAYQIDYRKFKGFVHNNQNPAQDPNINLEAAAATYGVGGMATHWTCATPRHHPKIERSGVYDEKEWDQLYREGERLLNTHTDVFEKSIRHQVVRDALASEYSELPKPYQVQNLPLAVERRKDNPALVHWSGTDTVLGPLADGLHADRFQLLSQHLCRRLHMASGRSRIDYAEVHDMVGGQTIRFEADTFVVACGAVLTPQVLWASNIRPAALGRYMTEQPVAFCQIVLRQSIIDGIAGDRRFSSRVSAHRSDDPKDPVPIPHDDPEPNVWIPVSEGRPWHCQIHRDAFHYGDLAPNVDTRLIVDLRWFGISQARPDNRVTFSHSHDDIFGMPQPTFEFMLSSEERQTQHLMMKDMLRAASTLGGFLPGSEPQFVAPGLPLHIAGTTRIGTRAADSVVDRDCRVWGVDNLYLGGNCLIPTGQASNPTLTSVAFALRGVGHILAQKPVAAKAKANGAKANGKKGVAKVEKVMVGARR